MNRCVPAERLLRVFLVTVLLLCLRDPAEGAIRTVPPGKEGRSEVIREALTAPTEASRIDALIGVLSAEDLPAALEAMEILASIGPPAVPQLVSEMRRTRNNWLIGGTLVKMGSQAVVPLIELLEQADQATVVDSIYLLGEIQDKRAIPTLVRYLEDPRARVRMYAVSSLLQIGGPRAAESVLSRLTREGKGLESFIVEALLRYGRRSVEPILMSLSSGEVKVRTEAAYLLGGLGDVRAVEPLLRALDDPAGEVRQNAAYALGELSSEILEPVRTIPSLARLLSDPSEEVGEAARGALVRFGDRAVPTLLELCRTGSVEEVVAGLNALREIGSSEAEGLMIDLLGHRDHRIRVAAVAGLIATGTGNAVEPLLDALRDEDLRWFAALALEKLGSENPRLFFTARPNDPTMSLRTQILVRLGTSVVPVLLEYLKSENVGRRATALWILGEIGEPTSASAVASLLTDPHLAWLAGRSLQRMGEPGLEELVRCARFPPDDRSALEAVEALALFDDSRAWDVLEDCVRGAIPRAARVRSAVLLSVRGEPERVSRLRAYLDADGHHLWPDVKDALRQEGQIR